MKEYLKACHSILTAIMNIWAEMNIHVTQSEIGWLTRRLPSLMQICQKRNFMKSCDKA